ncbi:S8 family serine peptidase [Porphyromonas sp. COT-108 OH2963]|uniref:S8 family serine peptidase n=1 Tax=Porphyromonas sp. COT-108 OH2963 TaxID=1515614 RepID=UPI0009E067B4|nr:S8 family serine peptidase [Porphyromonas sp. COT-108 OH2963]
MRKIKMKMVSHKNLVAILIVFAVGVMGCRKDEYPERPDKGDNKPEVEKIESNKAFIEEGYLRVMLTPELEKEFSITGNKDGLRTGSSSLDLFLSSIGAKSMTPVFPGNGGAYEKYRRAAGLHLWYDIQFDKEKTTVLRAGRSAEDLKDVFSYTEPIYKPIKPESVPIRANNSFALRSENPKADPRLPYQWHHSNVQQLPLYVKGIDINSLAAWEIETGKPNVIIAVLDGGVEVTHEDLQENIWVNPPETREYGDDVNGYNFVLNNGNIEPDDHGTHVAGIISARRMNGIGVAGVAGGDVSSKGVKIMSCQVFSDQGNNPAAAPRAFVYAAEHGAVVAQCSWGMGGSSGPDELPRSYKVAIDYFIDMAGIDPKTGEQASGSPMKGGVVVFAAGNNAKEIWYIPGSYSRVVAVSSIGPAGKRAVYSNSGVWVDIAAPGGDYDYGNPDALILSTVTDNQYGYMQGTSQAAPLVSGVAGLVLSKFGGKGFTNEDLKKRLLSSLRPFDLYSFNPNFVGKLGIGIIDAAKALSIDENKKPEMVENVNVERGPNYLDLTWRAVADEDDETAILYYLCCLKDKELNEKNILKAKRIEICQPQLKSGDVVKYRLSSLEQDSEYSMAIISMDRWGHQSKPYFFHSTTLKTIPPKLSRSSNKDILLVGSDPACLDVAVEDSDGYDWKYKIEGETKGVEAERKGNLIKFRFHRVLPVGRYNIKLIVFNDFSRSVLDIPFTVAVNKAPNVVEKISSKIIPITKASSFELQLMKYFSDFEGEDLSFEAHSYNPTIAIPVINGDKLSIKAEKKGLVHMEVTAKDPHGAVARIPFDLQLVEDDIVYLVYPIPAQKELNVRLSDDIYSAKVEVYSQNGQRMLLQHVSIENEEGRLIPLQIGHLSAGTYFLIVEGNGKRVKRPFIKIN